MTVPPDDPTYNPGNPAHAADSVGAYETGIDLAYLEGRRFWFGVTYGLLISVPLWTVVIGGVYLIVGSLA